MLSRVGYLQRVRVVRCILESVARSSCSCLVFRIDNLNYAIIPLNAVIQTTRWRRRDLDELSRQGVQYVLQIIVKILSYTYGVR